MEWIPIAHVLHENGQILQLICDLLDDPKLRNGAADCLLEVKLPNEFVVLVEPSWGM